jgi:peptidoglycan L-alanyl-D-glutamate endopeptidase CwlK
MPKNKFKYSERSLEKLEKAHTFLKEVFLEAIKYQDIAIIETFRDQETQDKYFAEGKSRLKFPFGKHNNFPSKAIDAAPFLKGNISWNKDHNIFLAGKILILAQKISDDKYGGKYDIRWGGDWDKDNEPITDQDFQDLVHYELIENW